MLPSIHQLDNKTSKSIQASLIFPTLSSIVLALVYHALESKPASRIEVYIHLSPEWQITCRFDAPSFDRTHGLQKKVEGSSLEYLSHLGILDIQTGQDKYIEKAGDVVFSGILDSALAVQDDLSSSVTIRDILCNLPVRRQALSNPSSLRSELERCRRLLAVAVLPHHSTRFSLKWHSPDKAGSTNLLDAPKTTSLLSRYEHLFSLSVTAPGVALSINTIEHFKGAKIDVRGFVVISLLSSRSHQHLLLNGLMEDDKEYRSSPLIVSQGENLRDVVLQVLQGSYIGIKQTNSRGGDEVDFPSPAKCFGYFLDIKITNPEQLDRLQVESIVRKALSKELQLHKLLPPDDGVSHPREAPPVHGESPTKKLRISQCLPSTPPIKQVSDRRFSLDRAGLLREPPRGMGNEVQAGWLHDILSDWKITLPLNTPLEDRISVLGSSSREDYLAAATCVQSLNRESLSRSRIIGQVDAKYVSLLYEKNVIVLVDQHAAHERVRLETLLAQYLNNCLEGTSAVSLKQKGVDIVVNLTNHLGKVFEDEETINSLQYWGFIFHSISEQSTGLAVRVEAVPAILHEKLSNRQALCTFLEELAVSLEDEGVRRRLKPVSIPMTSSNKANVWNLALRHLPQPILDLFNSMACRGAIMFNDPLTFLQCDKLVLQLSMTTFPFQCAHGRPSMTPICSLNFPVTSSFHSPFTPPIRWEALVSLD